MCEMMMSGLGGSVMIGTGALLLVLVLLSIAALVKYLLRPSKRGTGMSHG